ncbi:MAG TPA: Ada metal-binding domain-containing protein [Rhizomicrobium sp.]|nr:Ada metal-binding domain-containing protein [Rhizomicrobium sp.]
MKLPEPMSWNRADARKGKFDGKFILGVLTTGIYCLPSCAARPPRAQNVRLFTTESEAKAAGLRACKRCRPDLYYKGEDENVALFTGLAARVSGRPEVFSDAGALAREAGVSLTKLGDLFRDHAHLAPASWLRRMRVKRAAKELLASRDKVAEIGFGAGFESESVFHRQFLGQMRMTPGAYRALDGARVFMLQLPPGYRAKEILGYHARDPLSLSEKSEGNRIWKALHTGDGPAVVEISIEPGQAWVRVHAERKLGQAGMAALHAAAIKVLALTNDVGQFETRHADFVQNRRGLRMPLLPTGFDALCWGIIGQQINVKFASSLRRDMVELAGEKIGDMRAHPTPQRVADIDISTLAARRYSRSKARYLVEAAQAVATGKLDIESLGEGSAIAAEKALTVQHGIGTWTARYVLMRSGFADAAPVGDSALATALQRLHKLPERPDAEETARLMSRFAPHRSLATMHLWTSLKEAA